VRKVIKLALASREVECTALFDTGSGYTIIRRTFFEKSFGALVGEVVETG
jgi:hypothetical protein